MPEDFRRFARRIKKARYIIERIKGSHYYVKTSSGDILEAFAVSHGKRTKGGEVWDSYVRLIMKAIEKYEK